MELVWDDDPVPDGPFFTRDVYEKYSLTPHIRELWAFLQSPAENPNVKQGCEEAAEDGSTPTPKHAALKGSSCIGSQVSVWESCDSDGNDAEEPKTNKKGRKSKKMSETKEKIAFPEPRLPYPCMSSLSSRDQKAHVGYLMSAKTRSPPKNLMQINNEVMQFMKYLQDVAKICADDYNFITQGAMQYTEEFFKACLESIKALPQFYQIHEMTSLTGGTFNPGLALTFEKQLLTMGTVNITDHKMVSADAQLASDYHSVSSANPPAKKAKDKHAMISSDGNVERLCAYYEPHVCLTRDALVRLLDNHGPDFGDQWELPVSVKVTPGKGSNKRKTVHIDSPLLKREVTIRERSQIFHEESLKLSIVTNGSRKVFHLMTERPVHEHQSSQEEASTRGCMSVENNDLDFDVDLIDLETFGETATKTSRKTKRKSKQDDRVRGGRAESIPGGTKSKLSSEHFKDDRSSPGEINCAAKNTENTKTEASQLIVSEAEFLKDESAGSDQKGEEDSVFMADSDDEKLIIDDSSSVVASPKNKSEPQTTPSSADSPVSTPIKPAPANMDSSPPSKCTRSKRRLSKAPGDQLSKILRMQTAMFKSGSEPATAVKSPGRSAGPQLNPHTTSLVKPCVSSYLERRESEEGEGRAVLPESAAVNANPTQHKKILSENLQACAEDEKDYEAPVEGNLLYKLYSLQDLLVMVRSSVSLTHTRKVCSEVGSNQNQNVPVHVLPKLEYQLSYGVECLTSSEACQLWTETSLHSSTVSYIAHINAHTSEVALVRKLPDNWMQNISCGFKPSKSLNILHHLLKKLTGLDEGQYLIAHNAGEPFVTLLKASGGKGSRGAYNLQQIHSSVPQLPGLAVVPWIPVDPAVVLPFHQQHGRVPCTFPPKTFQKTRKDENNSRAGQKKNLNVQKKGKRTKRKAKRDQYIKNLIQMSV